MNSHAGHTGHEGHPMPGAPGGDMPNGHGAMSMVWNWGYDTVIVFDFWRTNGPGTLFISCVVIFLLSFLFEYFRTVRATQDRRLLTLMETGGHDRYEEEGLLGNRSVRGEGEREDDFETESSPIHTFRRRGVPPATVGRGGKRSNESHD
ncbi:hypothetical protein, variant [Spizellomyces punctatus DAOM BR117]|uniref:Copper transport protein n=1 Tax=Spizellomyces punctatus (strain DAOM BR117) TaxID=645134 RepID=A0A0L0H7B5_SPIPD|nr:hypothetical protein, variant [Spizellomyces punctatus DAOM BR117]KNC97435.1 hypothetical protein, variant [Spizellomyces punctatus DAOM BR117]|eukprot:XP_016605475.1 hypothetical protein, variant [Spizellomyces punctatus DAOM BR117]